jgi:hypothetical protein
MADQTNKIPGGVAKTTIDSFSKKEGFVSFNSYQGDYVIINSGRLIFNSKEDSIFLTSAKTLGISVAEQVHINVGPTGKRDSSKHYMVVNSPLIQLGLPTGAASERNEPVAKAHATIQYVSSLISALNNFCTAIAPATALGIGVSSLPQIATAANVLKQALTTINNNYGVISNSPIPSKVTKTL